VFSRLRFTLGAAGALILALCGTRAALAQPQSLYLTDAPVWLHYFCDSTEPNPNGSVSVQGAHCYSSLTIPTGATLAVTDKVSLPGAARDLPRGEILAFVNGACTIAGTIAAGAFIDESGNGGGSGGGGGSGAPSHTSGVNGADSVVFGTANIVTAATGGLGGGTRRSVNQPGAPGSTPTAASQKFIWGGAITYGVIGGSIGGAGGNSGGAAGLGGGGVGLVCASINFTGAIDVSGGDGLNAPSGSSGGGGGGGGGGVVLMATPSYVANTGSIIVDGGAAGNGAGGGLVGGAGGKGWFKQFTLQ